LLKSTTRVIKKWGNSDKNPDSFVFPILEPGLSAEKAKGRIK
jgi:hypothetical protein